MVLPGSAVRASCRCQVKIEATQPRHNGQDVVGVPTASPVQALAESRCMMRGKLTMRSCLKSPHRYEFIRLAPSAWRYSNDTESTTTADAVIAGQVSYSSSGMAAS